MATYRREFIRNASLVTAGLGVAGRVAAEATNSGAKTGLDMLILGGTGFECFESRSGSSQRS